MAVSQVLVQKEHGEIISPSTCAAWRGFSDRGFEIEFYEWPSLRDGEVPLDVSRLVVGGAGAVTFALAQLGISIPTIDDLPESLADFRGRRVWHTSLGAIRRDENNWPVFIKPRHPKAFPGHTVSVFRDLIPDSHLPDDLPVLASDPVTFISEWRFYVLRHKIIGAACYSGDPLATPDVGRVSDAVATWAPVAPTGYAIDFGVTDKRQSLLIEVNDGYSLGCLGLRPLSYSQLLEARWDELMDTLPRVAQAPHER